MQHDIPYAQMVDALSDGVYLVDRDRRITYWNAAACRITGYRAEDVVGTLCPEGVLRHVDEDGTALCGGRCPLEATMRDGVGRQARVFAHGRDGSLVPVHIRSSALRDATGEIVGAIETFSEDSDRIAVAEQVRELEHLAMRDPLTGLANRRLAGKVLRHRLQTMTEHGTTFGVLVVDVDQFKAVNDEHGHDTGDAALRAVGHALVSGLRADDVVARWGGDEFVVVTSATSRAEFGRMVTRVADQVTTTSIDVIGGQIHLRASVGSALARRDDDEPGILRRADQDLLRAKRAGRRSAQLST